MVTNLGNAIPGTSYGEKSPSLPRPADGPRAGHQPWCTDCKRKHDAADLDADSRCSRCAKAAASRAAAAARRGEDPAAQPPSPRATGLPAPDRDPGRLEHVALSSISPDPDNPRESLTGIDELAASIKTNGLIQPLIARRDDQGDLVLVAGHRRLAALQLLGWATVDVVVRRDMAPDAVLAAMLVENGQRAGLDPIEEARALRRLAGDNDTRSHRQLAAIVGRTQVHVSSRLALLELPAEDQEAVRAGQMNVGDAVRRGRIASGRVKAKGSTGHPHLGVEHDLASRARARCAHLKHKSKGRNSVGGVACGVTHDLDRTEP